MLALGEALEVSDERLGAMVELLVEAVDRLLVVDPTVSHSQLGQRSWTSQCVGEASSHSTG